MKIKLDENLPLALQSGLGVLGHDVETVASEGLCGADDCAVWSRAQSEGRFLLTQDLDFSDLRRYTPGTPAGLLLVRLRVPSRAALTERVMAIAKSEPIGTWAGCFVTATDSKVRIRRPI